MKFKYIEKCYQTERFRQFLCIFNCFARFCYTTVLQHSVMQLFNTFWLNNVYKWKLIKFANFSRYWKSILSNYFSHVHLHRRVHFKFAFMHLHKEHVLLQAHFTSRLNTSLARGSEIQIGMSFPFSSTQPWSVGLLTGIMDMWAVVHMLAW